MKYFKLSVFTILFIAIANFAHAQESNNGKRLWAKSILNEKAPKLVVEEWISEKPNTEGKFVLIDFWATWCGPCIRLIPKLNDWHKKFGDKLVIIGLSDETSEKVKSATNIKIDYFNAIDAKKVLKDGLEVKGIPHCILIDPQGIVRWEGFPTLGGHELTEEIVQELMNKYAIKK